MTIEVFKTERIRELNDRFRKTFTGGKVCMTRGIVALPKADQQEILRKVQLFNDFTEDNDPYGEHDFGALTHHGEKIYWKIDCYDEDFCLASRDPAEPSLTKRVLTIMLASEW